MHAMLHIILYQPEIPPNTGNIIRLCANTGAQLHLIEPLGFELDDRRLQRAGLDYHEYAAVCRYSDWQDFKRRQTGMRIVGFSTKAAIHHSDFRFTPNDGLLFGPETRGLPEPIRTELGGENLLRLPMKPNSRSLNLSNTVAVGLYEAWRQLNFLPLR